MAGDDSKGGASNCKSHYSKSQHSNSHAKGHHSKSHHDKSSRPETGTRATEDLYNMESGATKKKKRRHHRPKPKPRLPTDFLALLCWDSWLPWPIDSKKTQIDKTSRKHKRSRKRTSHSGTSHRVQSWVREVSSQVTPSVPTIPPTVASLAPSAPPSHSVSSSSGPHQEAEAAEAAMQTRKSNRYGHLASIRMPADRRPPSQSETESVYARRTTDWVLAGNGPESRVQRPAGHMVVSNYEPGA